MKTMLPLFMLLLLIFPACAQKAKQADIPATVKAAFTKLHPEVSKVKWEKEDAEFEANFYLGKAEQSIVFDAQGQIMETEVEITVAELPSNAKEYIAQKFKNAKIVEATKITDAKGAVSYEAEVKGKDLIFDENGNLLQ